MKNWEPKMHDVGEAVARLRAASIAVAETFYGFALGHSDAGDAPDAFAQCSCEHDSTIHLSVRVAELPSIASFVRYDFRDVADLVVAAYSRAGGAPSASAIFHAMRDLDQQYDFELLDQRLEKW